MHRSTHIFLWILLIGLAFLNRGDAQDKPSIATAEFLSVLAKNVATVLSPALVDELKDGRPNRTAIVGSILKSNLTSSAISKILDATTESSKLSNPEADTVRSAQTQSEVRPGNQGYPFRYDDNNYRYNYPVINSQPLHRPEYYPAANFGNSGYYNSELYRAYAAQGSPDGAIGPEENVLQRGEPGNGVSAGETIGNGQTNRIVDPIDPAAQNPERYRNFDRFPFDNHFAGGSTNIPNYPIQSQRPDGRFDQPIIDRYNQNFAGHPNLPGNSNYQNSVGNNYPRNSFQSVVEPFQQRQQDFRSNSFDFLPSQQFQNPYDNYPRSLQRGPNFPRFFSGPYIPALRNSEIFIAPSAKELKKVEEKVSSSELSVKSEKIDAKNSTKSTDIETATENPEILSVQGKIRFGRLLLPAAEDYSDLRIRPDSFRQHFVAPNNNKNNSNNTNDV